MAKNALDAEIRSRIDSFLTDISAFVKQSALASVQEALAGDSAPARRGRTRSASHGRPRKAGGRLRRSGADLEKLFNVLLGHVRKNPGQRLEEIGKALRKDTSILKRPVAKLVASKQLRMAGQKRGARYTIGRAKAARKASRKATRRTAKRRAKRAA